MNSLLEGYSVGRWYRADVEALLDASAGEEMARISSRGLDLASMVGHGRPVSGPAIRELTVHERAGLLRYMGPVVTKLAEIFGLRPRQLVGFDGAVPNLRVLRLAAARVKDRP